MKNKEENIFKSSSTSTATISLKSFEMKEYELDYDKVKTIEDVVTVLRALNLKIYNPEQNELYAPLLSKGFLKRVVKI